MLDDLIKLLTSLFICLLNLTEIQSLESWTLFDSTLVLSKLHTFRGIHFYLIILIGTILLSFVFKKSVPQFPG